MMTLNFSGRYALIAYLGVPSCALRYAYARVRTSSDSPVIQIPTWLMKLVDTRDSWQGYFVKQSLAPSM